MTAGASLDASPHDGSIERHVALDVVWEPPHGAQPIRASGTANTVRAVKADPAPIQVTATDTSCRTGWSSGLARRALFPSG